MRSLLRNIRHVEAYLDGELPPFERERFQERLLLEPDLFEQVQGQKQLRRWLQLRGRRQLRRELKQLHRELFSSTGNQSWQQRIRGYFGRH